MNPLTETYLRITERLLVQGWPEDLDLDEAVVSDPEYVAAVRRSVPPVRLGNAEQRRLREVEVQRILAQMKSAD